MAILGMRSTLGLIVMAFLWPIEASEASCGKDAKSSSLLSLKADIVSKTVEETEEKEHGLNGTVCLNCSNHTGSNQSLENLIKTVLTTDMNHSGDMPDPVANDNDTAGSLGQNLEFLYMKVVPRFQSFSAGSFFLLVNFLEDRLLQGAMLVAQFIPPQIVLFKQKLSHLGTTGDCSGVAEH